jgi:hypothetical protein
MASSRVLLLPAGPSPSMPVRSVAAMALRNRPVPAAHLSFMAKASTRPEASSRIALLSCPPTSTTRAAPGKRAQAPRA